MSRTLIIEGGGMKAAYANGVLSAFEALGANEWDGVMGTSAGGALAAWYSAGQARHAEQTWQYARDRRVLSYRRALRAGPVLDHEALLDIVYVDELPIDTAAIDACPWPVIVTAADIDSGDCVYKDIRGQDVIAWLKATGRLPVGCGPCVEIDGRRYIDGGAIDPIPIQHAMDTGATHITLILNTPPGPKRPDARLLAELAARRYPMLRDGIVRHQEIKAAAVATALDPPEGVQVDILHPSHPLGVHRLSRDMPKIEAAIEQGRLDGAAYVESSLVAIR